MITKKLLSLNGLSILSVVLYHAVGWAFIALFWWTDQYRPVAVPNFDQLGSSYYYVLRFIEQVIIFAIAAFLFVSGYFIGFSTGKNDLTPKWKTIFSRIKLLVIPFLIWSVIMIGFKFIEGERPGFLEILGMIILGKSTEAFYFIPLLVQFYLLAPLITYAAKKKPAILLGISAFFLLLVRFGNEMLILNWQIPGREIIRFFLPAWFFPGNLFWFALGVVVAFNFKNFTRIFTPLRWVFLVLAILLIPVGIWEWETLLIHSGKEWIPPRETILDVIYGFSVLIVFLTFKIKKIAGNQSLNNLGTLSFGIYLAHSAVLTVVAKLVYRFFPALLGNPLYLPLLIVCGLFLPIILIMIVKKSPFNRWYGYLFG